MPQYLATVLRHGLDRRDQRLVGASPKQRLPGRFRWQAGQVASTIEAHELSNLLGPWTTGAGSLSDDLEQGLAGLIDAGLVPAGATLPPQRGLARAIGVSRGTVVTTYAALEGRGYLLTRQGSGSIVRSERSRLHTHPSGRLFSFTAAPSGVLDLSSGALPASSVARTQFGVGAPSELAPYLDTDGYFPCGLPVLRQAVADQLCRDGLSTTPQQVLVTAGAQQATWVALNALVDDRSVVLVEEPSYRGALEACRSRGVQLRSVPLASGGIDPDLVRAATRAAPGLLYCQAGIQNPTGRAMGGATLHRLAEVINDTGLLTVDDRCYSDLTMRGPAVPPSLATLVDPELILTIGSTSKLFWGGLRIGWIRSSENRVNALAEVLKAVQLGCSVAEQLTAARLIPHTAEARAERRTMLSSALPRAEALIGSTFPDWTWQPVDGGSGLWVDTGVEATALAEHARRAGIRMVAGPTFSANDGQETMIRIPIWHEPSVLEAGLDRLAALQAKLSKPRPRAMAGS